MLRSKDGEAVIFKTNVTERRVGKGSKFIIYIKKFSRHKNHFQGKPKPKIVATLNFISGA